MRVYGSANHLDHRRRAATGAALVARAVAGGTLVLRKLAESRATEVAYQRFLSADAVTADEILSTVGASTAAVAADRRVLAIQDTTEISFGRNRQQPAELGPGTDDHAPALFAHPVLAEATGRRLEGRTARQQNPHPKHSLAWLAWIVARLGGWHGYYKPPGPKTMRDRWDVFAAKLQGYAEALDDLQQNP